MPGRTSGQKAGKPACQPGYRPHPGKKGLSGLPWKACLKTLPTVWLPFYAALGSCSGGFIQSGNTMDSMLGTGRRATITWAGLRRGRMIYELYSRPPHRSAFILAGMLGRLNWKKGWRTLLQDRKSTTAPTVPGRKLPLPGSWISGSAGGIYHGKEISRPVLNNSGKPVLLGLCQAFALFKGVSLLALIASLVLIMVIWQGQYRGSRGSLKVYAGSFTAGSSIGDSS